MKLIGSLAIASLLASAVIAGEGPAGHHHSGEQLHGDVVSAVGSPAKAEDAHKLIHVSMLDSMRYVFEEALEIAEGDVIRFVVTNKGAIRHEFSIGNRDEQKEHAELMRSMPNMVHSDGNTISLAPGESGEIIWRFQGDNHVIFACNVPGHFEAGMFANVELKKSKHSH